MPKTLYFEKLSLMVKIGTGSEERARPQKIFISGKIELAEIPWGNDLIQKTVDYDRLIREIVAKGEGSECCLLERLGEILSDHVLGHFPGASEVTLSLWKDPPPLPLALDRVGLTIRENRAGWEGRRRNGTESSQERAP
ncbi:MAG: dihydroneopterin aldolase [Nitrospirae bacterium]|jgi:FolB domain-containing protein|nr:dihydroneopterin aldolase [Nitrospirota bacterium]